MAGNLPKPIERQREVLYMPAIGHSVVLGTAGSGKTTLALYRAAYLSESTMPHGGNTLLLTFNRALVTYLKHLNPHEIINVEIENYHRFARGYLNARGRMLPNCICSPQQREKYIVQAVKVVQREYNSPKFFEKPIGFFMDEIQWIFQHGITDDNEYVRVERIGRFGANISREYRPIMYRILEKYIELRNHDNKLYDWDDLAMHVRREFENDTSMRRYKHIVVDEGQDFSPEMIRSLTVAIPDDGSLSFFGDVAQQIYGKRMSWRSAKLSIRKQWEFKQNYRNTKQISQLALAISKMPFFRDIPDLVEPISPSADGVMPTLIRCTDENSQMQTALRIAQETSKSQSVAILVKDREQETKIFSRLSQNSTRLHRDLQNWQAGPGLFHGTYHSSKGLEFDMVILLFLDSILLPDKNYIETHGEEDSRTHYGRLLYVAVTRAKASLLMLYSDKLTSLLPPDKILYHLVHQ